MGRYISRYGEAALKSSAATVDRGVEVLRSAPERAGRRVQGLTQISDRLGQLQRLVDEGFRRSVERGTNLPAVQQEMRRIERSLKALEARITRLRMRGDREPPAEAPPGQDRSSHS